MLEEVKGVVRAKERHQPRAVLGFKSAAFGIVQELAP